MMIGTYSVWSWSLWRKKEEDQCSPDYAINNGKAYLCFKNVKPLSHLFGDLCALLRARSPYASKLDVKYTILLSAKFVACIPISLSTRSLHSERSFFLTMTPSFSENSTLHLPFTSTSSATSVCSCSVLRIPRLIFSKWRASPAAGNSLLILPLEVWKIRSRAWSSLANFKGSGIPLNIWFLPFTKSSGLLI